MLSPKSLHVSRAIGFGVLVGYGALAWAVWVSNVDTRDTLAWARIPSAIGPRSSSAVVTIDRRIKSGLSALDRGIGASVATRGGYRSELESARDLGTQALPSSPLNAKVIERLAAVTWELGLVDGRIAIDDVAALTEIAASRRPQTADEQMAVGLLLYRMGLHEKARDYLCKAISLSRTTSKRLVTELDRCGAAPAEIVATLRYVPEVLVAAKDLFIRDGEISDYFDILTHRIQGATPEMLGVFGEIGAMSGKAGDVVTTLRNAGTADTPEQEAERQLQIGSALGILGDTRGALDAVDAALAIAPSSPRVTAVAASIALRVRVYERAEQLARAALSEYAEFPDGARLQGWVYRILGNILEARGRGDEAVDAYRRAVAADPEDKWSGNRLQQFDAPVRDR